MTYDFKNYLFEKLTNIAVNLDFRDEQGNPDPVSIYVADEQNFAKMEQFTPNTIYVVIKYLSSDIQYDAETMPIQILVLSEQDSLDKAKMLMNKFANDYNWQIITDSGTWIKQQYSSPVVLNNYVEIGHGYRSVLYVSGTLYIMENIVDVKNVTIDDKPVTPLSFNVSYSMSTNTQQIASDYIASSVKTVSTFALTMTIPMLESELVTKVMKILDEQNTFDGNNSFAISFECGLEQTENNQVVPKPISKTMRLISAQITTAPNQVPGLQLGFMK